MTSSERAKPIISRARVAWLAVFVVLVAGFASTYGKQRSLTRHVAFDGTTMGTTYSVKLGGSPVSETEYDAIFRAITSTLERVDGRMSTYRDDSELSRFNRHASTEPFAVSDETAKVFLLARQVSERTGGAFDVTVAPLVAAWGFGAGARLSDPPTDAEIARIRVRVGYRLVNVDPKTHSLIKLHPEVHCDLSAIAKGYAVDAVAEALEQMKRRDYLIEIGGEVRVKGHNAEGRLWRVGIERPDPMTRRVAQAIELRDMAVATSGSYRNVRAVRTAAGEQYASHTIDPRTGVAVPSGPVLVTVVHESTAIADALATAFHVLGPREGLALAVREGLAVLFVSEAMHGEHEEHVTPRFEQIRRQPAERPLHEGLP